MKLTYPSRTEAMNYRNVLQEAVEAARKGEQPEKDALAWPEGLDRTLLRGLPLRTHPRNCLVCAGLVEGDNALTVPEDLCHKLDLVHRVRRAQANPRAGSEVLWPVTAKPPIAR